MSGTEQRSSSRFDVPDEAETHTCPHCERPFSTDRYRRLHVGLDHPDLIDDEERETFQETYLEENDELGLFRLKILAVLVLIYFSFLFVYLAVN